MAFGRFTALLGFVLAGMSGLAACQTPIKYNTSITLCGTLGKGSYWSDYGHEHAHWSSYFKMHINNPIDIEPDMKHGIIFAPKLYDVTVVVVGTQARGIGDQINADYMKGVKDVCLSGYLIPILAGRWTQYVLEKVALHVHQVYTAPSKAHSG
jgi:hypothetical protein